MALSERDVHEILNRFDFDSVHEYMKETNWTWTFESKIPEWQDLYNEASSLLFDVLNNEDGTTVLQCGGFAAIKIKNVGLMLFFTPFEEDVWVLD